jgi:hypothetical protein
LFLVVDFRGQRSAGAGVQQMVHYVCDVDECASEPCQHGECSSEEGAAVYSCTCVAGWGGDNCADTLAPPPTFPGSQILSPAQQITVSSWAPQGPTQTWTLCFSSFTDDASDASVFHSQCDEYDVTMVVARHGAVPQTSGNPPYTPLASSPAWVEDAEWVFGGYVSALCLSLPCHVCSMVSLLALYCGLCLSSI